MVDNLLIELMLQLSQVKQMYCHLVHELILCIQIARVNFQLIFNTEKNRQNTRYMDELLTKQNTWNTIQSLHICLPRFELPAIDPNA